MAATDVPLSTLFFIYATIPAAMIVFFWFLMPDIPFGATKLKAFGSSTVRFALFRRCSFLTNSIQEGILAMQRGELRLQPFLTQLRSKEFLCATYRLDRRVSDALYPTAW